MKRKHDEDVEPDNSQDSKRQAIDYRGQFRDGLFDHSVLENYRNEYSASKPWKHGVISDLISPTLLRDVRSEVQNLSFTPKETDIYKIHQSGDLANLDGLDDSSLKLLPSLLLLRNAMYSSHFREYLSTITDSGPLSGRKTDMAINVYTPGCHLLCHDDVIGSRRVSYILYLTDPDKPWQEEWGGALRLYPATTSVDENGHSTKMPSSDHSVSIPPAFNQLSFFAVQPGESFHDVEEVYSQANDGSGEKERLRTAISGWYHIPQQGEDGYVEGLESQLTEKSSLQQLQTSSDSFDLPQPDHQLYQSDLYEKIPASDSDFSEEDLSFLLKFIAPTYLTPDTVESIREILVEECSISLENFLSAKFADTLKTRIQESKHEEMDLKSDPAIDTSGWRVARPPHKHRFLFQQVSVATKDASPLQEILQDLIPSNAFQKWLSFVTDHQVISHNAIGRRFRRGMDYTLATSYDEEIPRIEICLGITPATGWANSQNQDAETSNNEDDAANQNKTESIKEEDDPAINPSGDVGGYLAYMAGDEDGHEGSEKGAVNNDGATLPPDISTGGRPTRATNTKIAKQDPAIYHSGADDGDDGILFSMPASWNRLGIVLRDKGTMRFTKYVSRMAKGDRWDVFCEFGILEEEDQDEENHDDRKNESSATTQLEASTETEPDSNENNDLDDDNDDNNDSQDE